MHLLGNAAPSTNFLTVVAEFLAQGGAMYLQRGCRACTTSCRAGIGHGVLLGGRSCPAAQGVSGLSQILRFPCCPTALASGEQALNSLSLAMGSLEKFPLPVDQGKTNYFSLLYVELLFDCGFASSSRGALPLHPPRMWQ